MHREIRRRMVESSNSVETIIIETDEENPICIAVITADKDVDDPIVVKEGYRARISFKKNEKCVKK